MSRLRAIVLFLFGAFAAFVHAEERFLRADAQGTVEVAFSPEQDAAGIIVAAIRAARKQIQVQAYSFTNKAIARALINASARGVRVDVIGDREQFEKGNSFQFADLRQAGIKVWLDGEHSAAHNKVMIIDATARDGAVVTGSFNFTQAAQQRNAENVIILRGNGALTKAYADNWSRHRSHAAAIE